MQTFHYSLLSEARIPFRGFCLEMRCSTTSECSGCSGTRSIVYTFGSPQNPMVRQTFEVPGATVQFRISTEGQTSMSYWAVDNAVNVAPMHTFTVNINKS